STTVTLSAAATATGSGVALQFGAGTITFSGVSSASKLGPLLSVNGTYTGAETYTELQSAVYVFSADGSGGAGLSANGITISDGHAVDSTTITIASPVIGDTLTWAALPSGYIASNAAGTTISGTSFTYSGA